MLAILNAPNTDKDGKIVNVKLAALQAQVYERFQDRVYGKAVQRIQTHNTNETKKSESIEELQAEIARLEGKAVTIEMTNG